MDRKIEPPALVRRLPVPLSGSTGSWERMAGASGPMVAVVEAVVVAAQGAASCLGSLREVEGRIAGAGRSRGRFGRLGKWAVCSVSVLA